LFSDKEVAEKPKSNSKKVSELQPEPNYRKKNARKQPK
jgi:hypothetical protein